MAAEFIVWTLFNDVTGFCESTKSDCKAIGISFPHRRLDLPVGLQRVQK